jgi:hypothetical protein
MSFEQTISTDTQGPEHWEGRGQSDWAGSCVVIIRRESRGRKTSTQATSPVELTDIEPLTED